MLENVALASKYSRVRHFFRDCVRHFDHVITARLDGNGIHVYTFIIILDII